ncbi:MAG: class I SAM-dependent methyltransferase [Acidimicrobiales bacterium]
MAEMLNPHAGAGVDTHRRVEELIDQPGPGWVVDAGAGHGAFTQVLVRNGYRTVGLEIKPGHFRCRSAPHILVDVDRGLPIAPSSLDGIVAIELIEHLECPLFFVREAARVLRMGGWMVVTTPNVLSLGSRLEFLVRGYVSGFCENEFRDNGHISPVSLLDLRRIGERAGLEVEAVTYNVGRFPLPGIYRRLTTRRDLFRNAMFGESLIVRLRKTRLPRRQIVRG